MEIDNTKKSTFGKRSKNFTGMIILLVFGIAAAFLTVSILDEFTSLRANVGLFLFITMSLTWGFGVVWFSNFKEKIEIVDSQDNLSNTIRQLAVQKVGVAIAAIAIGVTAAILSGQTISTTANTSNSLEIKTPANDSYQRLLTKREEQISEFSVEGTGTSDSRSKALEETNKAISSLVQSGRLDEESKTNGTSREIDGVFLFQFFSNLTVRVGTILIVLYIFNIFVKEFRRIDRRHSQFMEILIALLMQKEKIDFASIKEGRASVGILDGSHDGELQVNDTAFGDHFAAAVTKPIQEMAEAIGKLTSKEK